MAHPASPALYCQALGAGTGPVQGLNTGTWAGEIRDIAGDDRQAVVEGGCRDDEVGLREGVPGPAAVFDYQTPSKHDIFGDCEDSLLEYRSHFMSEPVIQRGAPAGVGYDFDAEAEFG